MLPTDAAGGWEERSQARHPTCGHNGEVDAQALALGELLRMWRSRLSPADVGLDSHGHRRAAGLRREEVAHLAGVSVDYVVRLEQGRSRTPSAQVVTALARALQLTAPETELLHRSAGLTPPSTSRISRHIPPGVQRVMARMGDLPLAAFSADWTMLASTPLWQRLFSAPSVEAEPTQNLLVQTFIDQSVSDLATAHGGPEAFESALVADLRRAVADHPGDELLASFVVRLIEGSSRFALLWSEGRVATHQSMTKTVHHPVVGDVVLDCDVLVVPGTDVKLVVYTTFAEGADAEKLDFLRVGAIGFTRT